MQCWVLGLRRKEEVNQWDFLDVKCNKQGVIKLNYYSFDVIYGSL